MTNIVLDAEAGLANEYDRNGVVQVRSALTPDEVDEIREHPWLGERIVAPVPALGGVARQVIACHHERWDGKGYPAGLKAEDIPLGARILSTVDYFDALMSERPLHKAMSSDAALDMLDSQSTPPPVAVIPSYALRFLEGCGSVKPGNIRQLIAEPDVDGALVGGASLDLKSFSDIVLGSRPAAV